jgi:hypothetical protein
MVRDGQIDYSSCNGDTKCEQRSLVIGLTILGVVVAVFITCAALRCYHKYKAVAKTTPQAPQVGSTAC